ncbi:TetR/AcrR family transcriptional regulator [Microvirga zambiensis]|uniref:TetR/AcrR family transcriptional regulator n=1 Tax=Microvirga zambiensis TaxID=1402137 RepID=UPI00191CCAF9|nr:TetR/AcrR family transcriptional regulator [Microvirga zambiensis]
MPKLKTTPRVGSPDDPRLKSNAIRARKHNMVREEILASATKLFADRGFRAVSLEEIAAELGYGKSSIYYYYNSKDDLLWGVYEYISDRYMTEAKKIFEMPKSSAVQMSSLIRMHVLFLAENKEWTTVFFRDISELPADRQTDVRGIIVRYNWFFKSVYQQGVERGEFKPLSPEIAVNAILGACNWMVNWFDPKRGHSAHDIADQFIKIFAEGYVMRRE